jgi:hypothetical protein
MLYWEGGTTLLTSPVSHKSYPAELPLVLLSGTGEDGERQKIQLPTVLIILLCCNQILVVPILDPRSQYLAPLDLGIRFWFTTSRNLNCEPMLILKDVQRGKSLYDYTNTII